MDINSYNLIYIAIWLLLPIIPALLFFLVLPSSAKVSGPFKGLQIKLGGSFAAFFLLFICLLPKMMNLIKDADIYEIWTIRGKILDSRNSQPINYKSNPSIIFVPPVTIIDNGNFKFDVIGTKKNSGIVTFPLFKIQADSFNTITLDDLDFSPSEKRNDCMWKFDFKNKIASLTTQKLMIDSSLLIPKKQINNVEADN